MSPSVQSPRPVEYDLLAPGLFLDPHPLFDVMRREAPVYFSPQLGAWVLTGYQDICDALRDPRLSVVEELKRLDHLSPADQLALAPLKRIFLAWGNRAAPEAHAQFIKLLKRYFTPSTVEAQRPRIQRILDRLIDVAVARGAMDVVNDVAHPMAMTLMAELLELPADEATIAMYLRCSNNISQLLEMGAREQLFNCLRGMTELMDVLLPVVEARRQAPGNDLVSVFFQADPTGAHYSDHYIAAQVIMFLVVGYHTTANQLCNGCAPDDEFFDTESVEFRETTTTGTTWSCATCGFNDPVVNGYEVPDLDIDGDHNEDFVRFISLKNAADVTYQLGTLGDEIVALNAYDQIVAQGEQLVGWKLYVSTPGGQRKILITSYTDTISSWKTNGSPMSAYGMAYLEDAPNEAWHNICPEFTDSPFEAAVTVLAGETYDGENKLVNANLSSWFTLACRYQAAYKMKRMGYAPHGDIGGSNLALTATPDQRQATLKMITADYCGTGRSFTQTGTAVYWRNRLGTVVAGQFTRAPIEALWNDEGAICVSNPRFVTLAEVASECILPTCTTEMYNSNDWEWVTRKP